MRSYACQGEAETSSLFPRMSVSAIQTRDCLRGVADVAAGRTLSTSAKCIYSLGEFSTNTALATTALLYASYFLINVAGLRPALAGLVPLIGRVVDAFADPMIGRLS